ncbi:MAG: reverse transcriptase (RNA-dependent DNA polymerase)-domain-containing protein [Olpidium bornovanus]|uniref:Reverse transcriptase (RNA-dependent DNA polymerase)-domain-containing protein n=1 Tax=Olpidium bornovanus TaxID=278681 RepID=A0A8H7ZYW6_9FUNG|nr:MAG: reverse transcriptase (RNA-dependent DNA polymerase)-domain-containing protein [Olpidium bornovanus]
MARTECDGAKTVVDGANSVIAKTVVDRANPVMTGLDYVSVDLLYGLKQAGRAWVTRRDNVLRRLGFDRLQADHGAYARREKDGSGRDTVTWILSWVDDLVTFAPSVETIQRVKAGLKEEFGIIEPGELASVVGLLVTQNRTAGEIAQDQTAYIQALAARYGLSEAVPAHQADERLTDVTRYRELIGAFLFVAMCTRPEVEFVVGYLGRRQSAPHALDWTAALRVLRYLTRTADTCLTYRKRDSDAGTNALWPQGFCDADYAECLGTRRSTSGRFYHGRRSSDLEESPPGNHGDIYHRGGVQNHKYTNSNMHNSVIRYICIIV